MNPLSRRQFVAIGALGTAGLAVDNKIALLKRFEKPWNDRAERSLRKFGDPVPTACVACPSPCPIVAYRDGDRIVQIGPNEEARAAICARAYEALEALYDPERIRRPLRRAGKRGEDRWAEISWGGALERIAEALEKAPDEAYVDLGRPDPLAGSLLPRLGVERIVDAHTSYVWAAREAQRAVYGAPLSAPDLRSVQTVLAVGTTPLDSGVDFPTLGGQLMKLRNRQGRLIYIGSYQGVTGSLADEWIPIRPGTEGLVVLGLARVVLGQGWYDRDTFAETVGTSAEKVYEALAPYSADLVESTAGIAALELLRLARRFVEHGPSICLADGAGTRGAPAVVAAAAVLNAVRGDPEAAGIRLSHSPPWTPRIEPSLPRSRAVKNILAGNLRASLYLAYRSNPVYWSPRSDWVRRGFADEKRIGLVVAMDTQLTETALLADIVLPAASDLEMWNLFAGYTVEGKSYALLQQPATRMPPEPELLKSPNVAPEQLFDGSPPGLLGEARQLGDVLLDALDVLGLPARDEFPYADAGAYIRDLIETTPELLANGGFAGLARDGIWVGRTATYPWASDNGFPTPTGTLEVGGKLVHRMPREFRRLQENVFALVVLRYPELEPGYAGTRWGREIRHQNPVYMNAAVADRMGLRSGDSVFLRSRAHQVLARVIPIEGIHPQAVALAEDFGHWAGGAAVCARPPAVRGSSPSPESKTGRPENPLETLPFESRPRESPWWCQHGPGVSVSALSPFASDRDGAQAWREIAVTVDPV